MKQDGNESLKEYLERLPHNPERLPDESYEDYRIRKKWIKKIERAYLKGRLVYDSKNEGTLRK